MLKQYSLTLIRLYMGFDICDCKWCVLCQLQMSEQSINTILLHIIYGYNQLVSK